MAQGDDATAQWAQRYSIETNPLGRGSFATVHRGVVRETGEAVAVKVMSRSRLGAQAMKMLSAEIGILRTLNHPNVVRLLDSRATMRRMFIVLEYCGGGDLAQFIQSRGPSPEAVARHFVSQLAAGLAFLRSRRLIHRDIKPQNLLLSENSSNALLKIADFGLARHLPKGSLAESMLGSPLYMAPEVLSNDPYDAKADLWSAGAVLYELVTASHPFGGANQAELVHNIRRVGLRLPKGITLSPPCVELLGMLLVPKPQERASLDAFLACTFLKDPLGGVNDTRAGAQAEKVCKIGSEIARPGSRAGVAVQRKAGDGIGTVPDVKGPKIGTQMMGMVAATPVQAAVDTPSKAGVPTDPPIFISGTPSSSPGVCRDPPPLPHPPPLLHPLPSPLPQDVVVGRSERVGEAAQAGLTKGEVDQSVKEREGKGTDATSAQVAAAITPEHFLWKEGGGVAKLGKDADWKWGGEIFLDGWGARSGGGGVGNRDDDGGEAWPYLPPLPFAFDVQSDTPAQTRTSSIVEDDKGAVGVMPQGPGPQQGDTDREGCAEEYSGQPGKAKNEDLKCTPQHLLHTGAPSGTPTAAGQGNGIHGDHRGISTKMMQSPQSPSKVPLSQEALFYQARDGVPLTSLASPAHALAWHSPPHTPSPPEATHYPSHVAGVGRGRESGGGSGGGGGFTTPQTRRTLYSPHSARNTPLLPPSPPEGLAVIGEGHHAAGTVEGGELGGGTVPKYPSFRGVDSLQTIPEDSTGFVIVNRSALCEHGPSSGCWDWSGAGSTAAAAVAAAANATNAASGMNSPSASYLNAANPYAGPSTPSRGWGGGRGAAGPLFMGLGSIWQTIRVGGVGLARKASWGRRGRPEGVGGAGGTPTGQQQQSQAYTPPRSKVGDIKEACRAQAGGTSCRDTRGQVGGEGNMGKHWGGGGVEGSRGSPGNLLGLGGQGVCKLDEGKAIHRSSPHEDQSFSRQHRSLSCPPSLGLEQGQYHIEAQDLRAQHVTTGNLIDGRPWLTAASTTCTGVHTQGGLVNSPGHSPGANPGPHVHHCAYSAPVRAGSMKPLQEARGLASRAHALKVGEETEDRLALMVLERARVVGKRAIMVVTLADEAAQEALALELPSPRNWGSMPIGNSGGDDGDDDDDGNRRRVDSDPAYHDRRRYVRLTEALALYMKASGMLRGALPGLLEVLGQSEQALAAVVEEEFQAETGVVRAIHKDSSSCDYGHQQEGQQVINSVRHQLLLPQCTVVLREQVEWLKGLFSKTLQRTEQCQVRVVAAVPSAQHALHTPSQSQAARAEAANIVLFRAALRLTEDASASELLGRADVAMANYDQARIVLQVLVLEPADAATAAATIAAAIANSRMRIDRQGEELVAAAAAAERASASTAISAREQQGSRVFHMANALLQRVNAVLVDNRDTPVVVHQTSGGIQ